MKPLNNIYQKRPITILDVRDQEVEILKPESIVLKFKENSKASFTYIDVGALCFSLRRSRLLGRIKKDEPGKVTEVILSSKESWRIKIVASLIEHIRTRVITKSPSTAVNSLSVCITFFKFCEEYPDFKHRIKTFEGFLSIYRELTDQLKHRTRLRPNNPLYLTMSSAAAKQREVRAFFQHYFNQSEIDFIKHVPSLARGRDNPVPAPSKVDRDTFVKFALALFHQLADAILKQDYAPVKLALPVREEIVTVIFSDVTSLPNIIINDDLTWPSLSDSETGRAIKKRWPNESSYFHHQVRCQTRQAKANRSFIKPCTHLSRAYILAQSAFIACFYAATGINPTQLSNLKVTFEAPKTTRGMRFSGLKARAKNTTVYPEFGAHFLPIFNKFKELRSYISHYFGEPSYWFFSPDSYFKKIDSNRSLFPLIQFIKKNNLSIHAITPTQMRKSLSVDFLNFSLGDIVITSKKLGNSINTVASNYAENSQITQGREFEDFYKKMFESALMRTRSTMSQVAVSDAVKSDYQTPAGHCSNKRKQSPHRMPEFTEMAPKPDCSRPETCLFCEHYSIIPDKEDIGKLLGLKELIKLVKKNAGLSDKHMNFLAPVFHRIDEIIELLRTTSPTADSIISEVQNEIEYGSIHPFWDEHYEFLMELDLQT